MNDDFHEASFEVYYVSVSQKLVILEFSPQFFFILTSVTSDTSWGHSMSLSNLYEVSKFSWICQLLYETLFVVLKLKPKETTIYIILDLLTLHHLGQLDQKVQQNISLKPKNASFQGSHIFKGAIFPKLKLKN